MKKQTRTILAVVLVCILAAAAFLAWKHFSPAAQGGDKTISVEVVHKDGTEKDFTIRTDAENLRAALEQEKLVAGTESEYGLYVLTVDGETVNEDDQEWWCFTKGGTTMTTGVDDTVIADGDAYEITFTTGW